MTNLEKAHRLIGHERERQVFKLGYDSAHDDQHVNFELAKAAQCYLDVATWQLQPGPIQTGDLDTAEIIQRSWPFEPETFKPDTNPINNLVKAGAMFSAEKMRIWRKGHKSVATSYDASINHCAALIAAEMDREPVPYHEAKLEGTNEVFRCVVEKLPENREILVGLGKDGVRAVRVKRMDDTGRTSVLNFRLTKDAFEALMRAGHRIWLLENEPMPKKRK
jgi:hypothetical protein